jgi:antitoxin ParD1/3/4
MANLVITIPDALTDFVDEQVRACGYCSTSEYIQSLVESEQHLRGHEALVESKLIEGIESGDCAELDARDWADIRRQVADRLIAKRGG